MGLKEVFKMDIAFISDEQAEFLRTITPKQQNHMLRTNQTAEAVKDKRQLIAAAEKELDENRSLLRFDSRFPACQEIMQRFGGTESPTATEGLNKFFRSAMAGLIEKAKNGKE